MGVIAVLCLAAGGGRAQAPQQMDLRDLRVGMSATELPRTGYADFTCAGSEAKPIAGWAAYRTCAADAAGQREVAFRYDDTPEHTTQVAGQPVRLSLVLDNDGVVAALRMQTEPGGRVFTRKRGVHFGETVMAHYGSAGWACTGSGPTARELPVGKTFIREHCEKTLGDRHLVVDRALFRAADQPVESFTSTSSVIISLIKHDAP